MDLSRYSRRYEVVRGGDSVNDTSYIELNDVTDGAPQTVLFGERSSSGELLFLSLVHRGPRSTKAVLLPLGLVEDFISMIKAELGEPGVAK